MIQIYKSSTSPKSLETGHQYNGQDVQKQLFADQYSKCYICEGKVITDYNIDHLCSQARYPDKKTDWSNLLLTCSYCNQKKSNAYDQIVNPLSFPIETLIKQEVDFQRNIAIFEGPDDKDIVGVDETIKLLSSIFNGKTPARQVREEKFYNEFLSHINLFQKACNQFLEKDSAQHKRIVCELLKADQEFLGFKYWIIQSNQTLQKTFHHCCQWNKDKNWDNL